jgi:hypothetical protein
VACWAARWVAGAAAEAWVAEMEAGLGGLRVVVVRVGSRRSLARADHCCTATHGRRGEVVADPTLVAVTQCGCIAEDTCVLHGLEMWVNVVERRRGMKGCHAPSIRITLETSQSSGWLKTVA